MKTEKMPVKLTNRIARISGYSLALVATTFFGLYAGLYLDKALSMAPNFTMLFLILGVILGFKGFIQEVIIERKA